MDCEILAPAGDRESARAALLAGADAVYLGLTRFSARDGAENFSCEELAETVRFAHLLGAKVYVALNTIVKDAETGDFFRAAEAAWNAGADALLMQDLFLGAELKARCPSAVLHLSTQAGCCNRWGAEIAARYGFSRVVLARETPLEEIAAASRILETEVFVQGALCTAFSGQCYFSSFAGGCSGNRGKCKQPCRKRYSLDRAGFETPSYALSTSDLCVGGRVRELLGAGVRSLKIEGRMRSPAYAAAAVKYYRAVLGGRDAEEERFLLRCAYNRGDYTEGLTFGDGKNFRSRDVQGHIGAPVGVLSRAGNSFICKSAFPARKGDGFKLLRGGKEVGGAVCTEAGEGSFRLASDAAMRAGDEVRVTRSAEAERRSLQPAALRPLRVEAECFPGKPPRAVCGDFAFEGEGSAAAARSAPLTEAEIAACFARTDGLPFAPEVTVRTAGAFLPKSALNAFRRAFYAALAEHLAPARAPVSIGERTVVLKPVRGERSARICGEGDAAETPASCIRIVKPRDYARIAAPEGGVNYLYLPSFFTAEDEVLAARAVRAFDGIYCEGYYGIALAEKYGKPLFAGTGFHLSNRYGVEGVLAAGAKYFALSKEIDLREQDGLAAEGAFALTAGDVKLMDLVACPFGYACEDCDGREFYRLTDEAGRTFPVRRYRGAGGCRFEVYNCAALRTERGKASPLADDSARSERNGSYTRGHSERSVL